MSADGTRVYAAAGAPYTFLATTPLPRVCRSSGLFRGTPIPTHQGHVRWANPGRCQRPVWTRTCGVYTAAGVPVVDDHVAGYAKGLLRGELKASGDALRFVALTDDPLLAFFTIGP